MSLGHLPTDFKSDTPIGARNEGEVFAGHRSIRGRFVIAKILRLLGFLPTISPLSVDMPLRTLGT